MHCAVAVLETANTFILEGALPQPAEVYPELRFWGGKVDPTINPCEAEFPEHALERELDEELGFRICIEPDWHLWTGYCENQTRKGRVAVQLFSLFHIPVKSVNMFTVHSSLPSRLVQVPRLDFEAIPNLTHFAREGLRKVMDPTYRINPVIQRNAA